MGDRHPLIEGLFAVLPEPGSAWPADEREKWFHAAGAVFGLLYQDSEADDDDEEPAPERRPQAPKEVNGHPLGETPTRTKVLRAMQGGARRLRDIVNQTGESYQTVASCLQNMARNGIVNRTDVGMYEIATTESPSSGAP